MLDILISFAIDFIILFQGSHVFLSNIFTDGPIGLSKILFHGLCLQLAILVGVPTPADIKGTVVLFDTTISRAPHNAATSSKLLK